MTLLQAARGPGRSMGVDLSLGEHLLGHLAGFCFLNNYIQGKDEGMKLCGSLF